MSRLFRMIAVLFLISGEQVAQPVAAAAIAVMDIRGPFLPTGLSPFVGSGLLLLVGGVALVMVVQFRRRRNLAPPGVQLSAGDELAELQEAFSRGEMSAVELFQRLDDIAVSRIFSGDSSAMTSAELLAVVRNRLSAELFEIAIKFFAVSDLVRYGGYRPDTATVVEAFTAVGRLRHDPPEISA